MCSVVQALIAASLPESPLLYWLKRFTNSGANSSSHEARQLQLAMRNGPSPSQVQHSLQLQLPHGAVVKAVKLAHAAVRAAASVAVTAAAAAEATEAAASSATAAAAARAAATAPKTAAAAAEQPPQQHLLVLRMCRKRSRWSCSRRCWHRTRMTQTMPIPQSGLF